MVASPNPSEAAIQAWARLVRVSGALLDAVEAELKAAGFPRLVWYDALLELGRAPEGRLRPFELERHMLLPQYSTSRLVDRLEKAGLVARIGCPDDRRGQHVSITDAGRALRERMWPAYAAAISATWARRSAAPTRKSSPSSWGASPRAAATGRCAEASKHSCGKVSRERATDLSFPAPLPIEAADSPIGDRCRMTLKTGAASSR